MASKPRISVLMTIYNAELYLGESINSLLAQTFTDWELIAIENGSEDSSSKVLEAFNDPRIKIFSFPDNIGRTHALRYAFEQVEGDLIAILDADDIAHPRRFEKEVKVLDDNPGILLVSSWAEYIDTDSQRFDTWEPPTDSNEIYECLGWMNPIIHSSVMFRYQAALDIGGYPEEFKYGQDFALFLRLARKGNFSILDEYLCQLRVLKSSMTRSGEYSLIVAKEKLELSEVAGKVLDLSSKSKRLNRRRIATNKLKYGFELIKNRFIFSGITILLYAICLDHRILWDNNRIRKVFGIRGNSSKY